MSSAVNIVQGFGGFEGSGEVIRGGGADSVLAESRPGDLPGEGGPMTFPATFAYVEAHAGDRECLGDLADHSDFDDSCR